MIPLTAVQPTHLSVIAPLSLVRAYFRGNQPHRVEIGYWLAKPFWGRGITSAVVRAVCQHAFHELKLVKITAHVFSFNDASAGVLEKNGFEQEGFCPKHVVKDGAFIDVRLFGLVRSKGLRET